MNLELLSGELEEYREAREFWMNMLSGAEEVDVLSPDRPAGMQNRKLFYEQRLSLSFTASLAEGLLKWSSGKDSLLYVILLSGVMTALAKIRSNPSIIVGCPTLEGMNGSESEAVNRYLPIRLNLEGSQTVKQLWKGLNRTVADAYGYQYYPLDHVKNERRLEDACLCNVACELDPMHDPSALQSCRQSAINGVTFSFKQSDEKICGELIYNADLYQASTMQSLADSFMHVLGQMAMNPDLQVRKLSLVNDIGIHQLLKEFHSNKGEFPADKSAAQLFEEQTHLAPDRTALVCGEQRLSYIELNERADRFAAHLAEFGIRRGHIIGVVSDRTPDTITAMLAVLKAGAAYLPIDPAYPQARINYMLEDSGAAGLITPSKYAGHIAYNGCVLLIQQNGLEAFSGRETFIEQVEPLQRTGMENIAYVIYTSGSTGTPKGVMLGHQGMANLHTFFRAELGIRESDKILQFASASFDASVWEMFMAFFTGAELHLIERETLESYESFTDYVGRSGITVATLPPTYAAHLDPLRMPTLRMLVTAGSASDSKLAKRWGQHMKYINAYGPTESTICATLWQTDELLLPEIETNQDCLTSVPIGKPILNTEIYIVNHENHLLPIGFMGELCIGGVSLALGYLGREQLTAERFVENPFVPGELMYRTGDYAKRLPDGNIEFLGRIDNQVKIRGFRIETGEIEAWLVQHPDISEAHVTAKPDLDGEACLCAYVSPWKGSGTGELKEWLAERLPAYMLPQYYIPLEKLPLSANGKIDTKALPEPAVHDHGGTDAADDHNATATERKLADLWKVTLGTNRVSLDDHFFNCGGHSLKAATLITEIHKHFQIQLTLRKLLEAPTLRGMAEVIDLGLDNGSLPAIEPAQPADYYPLSLTQKRMFILNQYEPEQLTYNIPVALRIEGALEKEKLQKAMFELVQRHETLRTSFMLHEGNPVQQIHQEPQLRLGYRTIQEHELSDELQRFIQPFDLAKAPLLRAELLHLAANRHVLCLDMHHIISDGVSMSVLIDDLMRLYKTEALEPLRLQYKDFSCWQNEMLDTGRLSEQEAFWLSEFAAPAPQLQVQTDYLRQAGSEGKDEAVKSVLTPEVTGSLHTLAASTGSTLYMVLLSAYSILLSLYSRQMDIVVGTPVAGRSRADLQPLVGMFVNILPIRSKPEKHKTFTEYLAEVKETAISAFENQDFPFDELVRKLNIARDAGRNPLFDASFALQNMDTDIPVIDGLSIEPVDLDFYHAKFDLTLWAEEQGDEILLALEYRTRLFKRQTAEKLVCDLNRLIDIIIESPHMQLGAIDLRTSEEIKAQEQRFMELEAALEMDFEL